MSFTNQMIGEQTRNLFGAMMDSNNLGYNNMNNNGNNAVGLQQQQQQQQQHNVLGASPNNVMSFSLMNGYGMNKLAMNQSSFMPAQANNNQNALNNPVIDNQNAGLQELLNLVQQNQTSSVVNANNIMDWINVLSNTPPSNNFLPDTFKQPQQNQQNQLLYDTQAIMNLISQDINLSSTSSNGLPGNLVNEMNVGPHSNQTSNALANTVNNESSNQDLNRIIQSLQKQISSGSSVSSSVSSGSAAGLVNSQHSRQGLTATQQHASHKHVGKTKLTHKQNLLKRAAAATAGSNNNYGSSNSNKKLKRSSKAGAVGSMKGSRVSGKDRQILLYRDIDDFYLTEYQCLLRQHIELFEATLDDVQASAQGRNSPIEVGQVGIRCKHCSNLHIKCRSRGAVYFPRSIDGIYQVAQNLTKIHLCQGCTRVPESLRTKLLDLSTVNKRASGGKRYWNERVRELGIYEDGKSIRFKKA